MLFFGQDVRSNQTTFSNASASLTCTRLLKFLRIIIIIIVVVVVDADDNVVVVVTIVTHPKLDIQSTLMRRRKDGGKEKTVHCRNWNMNPKPPDSESVS